MGKTILVTGASGLVGAEVSRYFHDLGFAVEGIENHQRAVYLGPEADTRWQTGRLVESLPRFRHHDIDIRDRSAMLDLVKGVRPDLIVHTAAQPSHDRSSAIPFDDFDVNAGGTLNLLEAARRGCPESPFVHLSTNKVYGDAPNRIPLRETGTRWEFSDPAFAEGIPEDFPVDASTHTLFGASKLAADILVQEYGRSFGMPTCCLRCGCITGPGHSGVESHGFLSYLVRCTLEGRPYTVFGHKGKQVRDNIHSLDVARFVRAFFDAPRKGEVYNLGGGKANACSLLEAVELAEEITGRTLATRYDDAGRPGDHICYYSDLSKLKAHYPGWGITRSLHQIVTGIAEAWSGRQGTQDRPPSSVRGGSKGGGGRQNSA